MINMKAGILRRSARKIRSIIIFTIDILGMVFIYPWLKHRREKSDKEKILIIRIDNIGDMVVSTPAIAAIREKFPDARIDIFIKELVRPVIENNKNLNNIYSSKKDISRDYTIAIALHPGFMPNYLTAFSGASIRVGYTGWGGGFYLTHKQKDDRKTNPRHETRSALNIAGIIGCSTAVRPEEVTVSQAGIETAQNFMRKYGITKKIIIIHAGSRQPDLRFSAKKFSQAADRLAAQGYVIVFIGAQYEKQLIDIIQSTMQKPSFWAGELELAGQIALIKTASLFIGNISGPMHIASALNIPVVALYGPKDNLDGPQAWAPLNSNSVIVTNHDKCDKACDPGVCSDFTCLNSITVDQIVQAAEGLLK